MLRRNFLIAVGMILWCLQSAAGSWEPSEWPVLRHYDAEHLQQIALPLGGIGTGTVSLGGRGELRDWEIMNVPGKGNSTIQTGNDAPCFVVYTRSADGKTDTRMLAGPLYPQEYLHYEGRPADNHGLPRFGQASFDAAYPFGQVNLSDPQMPVSVRIKGFNPLIPGDSGMSGLPIAVLSYALTNESPAPLEVAVCGVIRNFVGCDGQDYKLNWKGDRIPTGAKDNKNEYRQEDGLKGIYYYSEGVDPADKAWGNFTLSTDSEGMVSWRTWSADNAWSNSLLNFWDDFSDDGIISNPSAEAPENEADPMGALSVKASLQPGETRVFNFYLTWNFPNRFAWSKEVVGNYYSTLYPDSWESACEIVLRLPELERRTLGFVNAFLSTTLPDAVKEAALFNLSVLRSQTVFRVKDGHMLGWEGVMDRYGSCAGSCTHVWNYELATPFLFGDLARTMRDVEFRYALEENGHMDYRANLPLGSAPDAHQEAADGQMGCIMKLYREWQLSGDDAFLREYWPACRRALEYAWCSGGWDADCDGVMEGAQHNTMDVSYFGPNPQMEFWYLGALRAAEEMALAVKDRAFAKKCHGLFERGSAWTDAHLFNGEYYEQIITPDASGAIPPYQLGKGCLVDQLVGQYMAHICGLGYLGRKDHIRKTMESVMKYNFVREAGSRFNNMRSYVLGDESALLMASWPKGRLKVPFPYFAEAMTGFEYCAAVEMIYEGMQDDALTCIEAVRGRFDGQRRNPFDEPECGHHYARSMASWAAVIALGGFNYSGVEKSLSVTGKPGRWFWSNGAAWGIIEVTPGDFTLKLCEGELELRSISCGGRRYKCSVRLSAGESFGMALKVEAPTD
ncbi:MAG: hypothetical protein IJ222_09060 [Bacteroidales bacterium]|nr:hypothetical protein [Bacteroidales bacterium]